MVDFLKIIVESSKRKNVVDVKPDFSVTRRSDLMTRGGDFYAIWLEDKGIWSTNESDALDLIDNAVNEYTEKIRDKYDDCRINKCLMDESRSKMIDTWHHYCMKQLRDNFHNLDEKLIFANDTPCKKDYASNKRLNYNLESCPIPNYNKLMDTLYDPEEREKIEWAIGSIVTGDSKKIQKFMVLYGSHGTGKSTVLNIIQQLFDGYYTVFDAKALGSSNATFALEPFKNNPLVAIQHDGDLSRIEDNTRLNSLVSHELMTVNEKFKSSYANRFQCFLFIGSNKPVKITDAKSGLLRRLIDVTPSGRKLEYSDYKKLIDGINFELGGIACHCRDVYLSDPHKYDNYTPVNMMTASNDFYDFILDSYFTFNDQEGVTLKQAWQMYKEFCDDAKISYPFSHRAFREELKNYFDEYQERAILNDGTRVRSLYLGFKEDKFDSKSKKDIVKHESYVIDFKKQKSLLDEEVSNMPAQYANEQETPSYKWDSVRTKLKDIDTNKLHYVKLPENHIVIDFDLTDADGNKMYEKNLEEASKWPQTYAELSKSGEGIHLHYIYTGDATKLSRIYDDHVEIKVFTGNSSLRRKLSKCNDIPIASISSGLPLKGENKVINFEGFKNEKALRTAIKKNLNKEYAPSTKVSVNYIYDSLERAYNDGLKYDVSDLRNPILTFAASSTHQSDYCVKLVSKMHFKSEEGNDNVELKDAKLIFYDVEVYPNLFIVCWKKEGKSQKVVKMINPTSIEIEELMNFNLVGFNCRRYDNHMLYARLMGYPNEQLYSLSQRIINGDKDAFFGEAYNISYTDVYDFSSKKQSLKKFEIELGIHHQEMGIPWDKPAPEELWDQIADYCSNDVLATEAVFEARKADFVARQIQVDLVKNMHGMTNVSVNDTTNSLSTKIIFGKNRTPQNVFNYRDLSKPVSYKKYEEYRELFGRDYKFRIFNNEGLPTYKTYDGKEELPDGYSILPFFKGYKFDAGVSTYMRQEIGEGGRVYAEPGMYNDIWDGDVSSMHPHSIIFECLFGPEYTKRFADIVAARVAIKHKDFEAAGNMLGGALKPYLNEEQADDLASALKIVINSIYGLTSARFPNAFRDPRNIDNIVAKRGALFMTLLKNQVEAQGYKVAHIKTDSIKIPNATNKIKDFVIRFGKEYGYSFETEADFEKLCLVNDAVYVAKEKEGEWTATGTQFQVPYVFKTLFTKEPIKFEDMCETKEVKTALYLDMNEKLPENEHDYHFIGKVGLFCPIQSGNGAGILLREEKDGRMSAATGTKGYRWMESEMVKSLKLEKAIDISYYRKLVDDAIDTINQYGDIEWFINGGDKKIIKSDKLPDNWDSIS